MPVFTALNGAEVKAVFLDAISKAMDESGEFKENLTFPWVKFSYDLKLTSYPKAAMDSDPASVAKGEIEQEVPVMDGPVVETVITSEPVIIDTPDQARVDAGLPLPTAVPVKNVGIVDKPVIQAPVKKGK